MPTYIVLLRGVNVGKAKRVPMADFKTLLLGLGCTSATTLLNSGNAVVEAPRQSAAGLAKKIASAIEASLGFSVPVVVKTADEVDRIVAGSDLVGDASDHSRLLVAFAKDAATLEQLRPIADLVTPPERFVVGEEAAYLHCPSGILESKAGEALLGKVGKAVTTRNWATVLKLHALAKAPK